MPSGQVSQSRIFSAPQAPFPASLLMLPAPPASTFISPVAKCFIMELMRAVAWLSSTYDNHGWMDIPCDGSTVEDVRSGKVPSGRSSP